MIGSTLKHYKILKLLGKGGMGEVYLATDTHLDRQVALKTLPVDVARNPERRARFEREAKTVAALNHPNIVTIYSVEDHEGVGFITMELVEGKSLAELIPAGGLPLSRVFDIAIPLADALAVAHRKGVTHRDIKPGNVMINDEGRVKVLDFGLAKLAESVSDGEGEQTHLPTATAAVTAEGKILGTVAYMSPEQAEGKTVDSRSDIFSLGVVLYEMLTGNRPFHGDTPISTITSIMRDTPPPVGELKPGLPRHVARIVERCLAKQPDRRYQAALDVRNELEGLRSEIDSGQMEAVSSTPTTPPSPASHTTTSPISGASFPPGMADSQMSTSIPPAQATQRSKTLLVAGLVVGAVLIAAAASVLWPRLQTTPSGGAATVVDDKSIAVLPFTNMSDDKENEYFSDGLAEELLNRLSRVPELRVAARTSSFHFKGHTGDVSEVAQQLNVATILEGSVRRVGDRVRVTAQLIKASDGFHLWSEVYDRQLDDIFGIQDEIATQVVEALKITLLGDDAQRLATRPTDSVEAYDAYLLGHRRMRNRRADELKQAAQYLQRAIDLDPGFALAYVGQAEVVMHLSAYGTLSRGEMFERMESLLDKAMELDDQLGEVYAMRANLRMSRFDFDGAIADFERAIELNPNYAMAYMWYGRLMISRDPERSLSLFRQALELDPLSPLIHVNIAGHLERAGEYEEALKSYQRAVEIDPGFAIGYGAIASLYEDVFGRLDEAIHWSERAVASDPGNLGLRLSLGTRLQNRGRFDDALEVFRETIDLDPGFVRAYRAIAELHLVRGRLDEAIRWNHEAHQRDPSNTDPLFQLAELYFRLADEASGRLWLTRLREAEEGDFSSGFVQAVIHARRDELAKCEAIFRERAAQVPSMAQLLLFGWDLEAGNYDAILEREAKFEPGLFEDTPQVHFGNVEGALRVGAALAGRGDHPRAELVLGKCEEFLQGLDEGTRRARLPDLLGIVYLLQGRNDEALTEWRIAFENGWRHDSWIKFQWAP
ncbi:MAG: protein kinase, partial [Acidobacteria bacterium]|nr:protein kinase [Acidobacteriota bacterium]